MWGNTITAVVSLYIVACGCILTLLLLGPSPTFKVEGEIDQDGGVNTPPSCRAHGWRLCTLACCIACRHSCVKSAHSLLSPTWCAQPVSVHNRSRSLQVFGARAPAVRARLARLRTPILPTTYVLLLLSSFVLYLRLVVQPLLRSPIPGLSRVVSPMLGIAGLSTTLLTYAAACWTDPGRITKDIAPWHAQHTPLDPVLWPEHRHCSTCDLPRPPRAKHCPACGFCVARFDHHCLWLNGCVGGANLRWFLLFLMCNVLLSAYGVYAGVCTLHHTVGGASCGAPTWTALLSRYAAAQPALSQLVLFTAMAMAAMLALLLQHVWLLARGLTSYEIGKLAGTHVNICGCGVHRRHRAAKARLAIRAEHAAHAARRGAACSALGGLAGQAVHHVGGRACTQDQKRRPVRVLMAGRVWYHTLAPENRHNVGKQHSELEWYKLVVDERCKGPEL